MAKQDQTALKTENKQNLTHWRLATFRDFWEKNTNACGFAREFFRSGDRCRFVIHTLKSAKNQLLSVALPMP